MQLDQLPPACSTKYGWIYIKQTQNDNLTSDPPSALLMQYFTSLRYYYFTLMLILSNTYMQYRYDT